MNGRLEGNLYIVNFIVNMRIETKLTGNEQILMHRSMGHTQKYPLTEICEVFLQGKQKRNHSPWLVKENQRMFLKLFHRIFVDQYQL